MTSPATVPTTARSNPALPEVALPEVAFSVLDSVPEDFNLLRHLLTEQSELTAVELFSNRHVEATHAGALYQALMPTSALQSGQQYAFEVDLDACSGCKACVVACHTLNGLDEQETWRKVGILNSTAVTLPIVQHVTTACHHCIDPGCLKGCPVLAYEKDAMTGIVRHLDDQCFGCKYCLMMCPYEVPQYNASLGIVRKCDMCAGRLEVGEAPACVQACPNSAIRISIVSAETSRPEDANKNDRLLDTAPLNRLTQPTTRYISNRRDIHSPSNEIFSRECAVDAVQPGHLPLVAMLVLTQASVGVWCVVATVLLLNLRSASSVFAASVFATLVGTIGVHAALLHLGRPWLAFRSILGWRRSWLSREAIAFGLYLSAAAIAIACCVFKELNSVATVAVCGTAFLGCLAVVCSAMIYIATRRELWSPARTSLEFVGTTLGLGLATTSLFTEGTAAAVMLLCGTAFCTSSLLPKLIDWRAALKPNLLWSDFSGRSGRLLRVDLRNAFSIVIGCLALGSCLSVALFFVSHTSLRVSIAIPAVVALLVSQLFTRWLYFASVVFARMPGAIA